MSGADLEQKLGIAGSSIKRSTPCAAAALHRVAIRAMLQMPSRHACHTAFGRAPLMTRHGCAEGTMAEDFVFNPFDDETRRNPFALYARARREYPVYVHEGTPIVSVASTRVSFRSRACSAKIRRRTPACGAW
jgi:hypothetical protein